MIVPDTTPAALRAWRTRLDLTLEQAGAAVGVDKQTWWRWEAGRAEPQHPVMLARAMRDYERERTG